MLLYEKIQLEEGERVLNTVRKHWFIITLELLGVALMAALPIVLFLSTYFIPSIEILLANALTGQFSLITYAIASWLLLTSLMGFTIWTNYYLDLWVITDRRIIVIDQIAFFNRKVSSFRLERLQDIKVIVKGLIPTLLNFGTIRAQTAGANESNFASTAMPDPRGVQSTIQSAMDERLKALNGNIII